MAKSLPEMSPEEQVAELKPKIEERCLQGVTNVPIPWWVDSRALDILKEVFPGTRVSYIYTATYLVFPPRPQ